MLTIIILAAGKGTRMKSDTPKVMHAIGGKPMIEMVIDKALSLVHLAPALEVLVVLGHGGEAVARHLSVTFTHLSTAIKTVTQTEQMGTAHAVKIALPVIHTKNSHADDKTIILYGDVPLINPADIIRAYSCNSPAVLTAHLDNPFGYGRIIRGSDGTINRITEEKQLSPDEKNIREVNTGIMCVPTHLLHDIIPNIVLSSAGEYYLTDLIQLSAQAGEPFRAIPVDNPALFFGVNDPLQLAESERIYQRGQTETLLRQGVRMADPARVEIRGNINTDINIAPDSQIDIGVILSGKIHIGARVKIGAYCILNNVTVAEDTEILPYSHLDGADIGKGAKIGPYARLRPHTTLSDNAHIGNFVEIKNSTVGNGSKANHLAYIGDADIGANVNVGAGTITCNYDGANKHRTTIEDDVFIGSDCQLVAPVTVEKGATLGAGTTLTRTAPANALTLSRTPQKTIAQWQRPKKKK